MSLKLGRNGALLQDNDVLIRDKVSCCTVSNRNFYRSPEVLGFCCSRETMEKIRVVICGNSSESVMT
jgi:hypothetical protein